MREMQVLSNYQNHQGDVNTIKSQNYEGAANNLEFQTL